MVETMKAVVLSRFGGADAFELLDVPVPPVGARQLRVRVHATAVNPLDYQIRRGDYADLVPLPSIIGHDVSGVVEEAGGYAVDATVDVAHRGYCNYLQRYVHGFLALVEEELGAQCHLVDAVRGLVEAKRQQPGREKVRYVDQAVVVGLRSPSGGGDVGGNFDRTIGPG